MNTPTNPYAVLLAVTDGRGHTEIRDITPPECTVTAAVAVAQAELRRNPWACVAQVIVGNDNRVHTTLRREPTGRTAIL